MWYTKQYKNKFPLCSEKCYNNCRTNYELVVKLNK